MDLKLLQQLGKKFTILYVEDDLLIQKEMTNYLSKFFKQVRVAKDGEEGLQYYKSGNFDIVITDLSMPKMNGLEMLEKIRALHKEQTVLITTAHSEAEYMIKAIRIGIDGYIIKPFNYEQLNYELFKIVEKIYKYAQNEEYKKHLKRMVEQKTSELNSMIHFQKYNYEKTLLSMVEMIEDRDTYTAGHSQRVANYSRIIAEKMGFSKDDCDKVYQAGILHDIGKVATPDVVLLNPHKLNELEYKLIQEHVDVGYRLLTHIPMFKELAEIVYAHHERYNGSGYPRALNDSEIVPLAKIMAVADTFDAMTTNRIYKGRKTVQEALEELMSLKGILFNPDVVDAASNVLKNVVIDENIDQLPRTEIEKERFAYFYKDMLTDLYNQHYLEVVLVRNQFEKKYSSLHIFKLKNFSKYNKEYGWKQGDELLRQIAAIFKQCFEHSNAFRIFGDDFVFLDNKECQIEKIQNSIKALVEQKNILCEVVNIDLEKENILSVSDIEKKYFQTY
ncbi:MULTISPECIES: HD domain-containing phosphohydrolase [Sulfurimonas]|uniref:bifunctional diguanylate cyclase/phosphohydrolase n=1 Tax=Sulfurimonas TaxID=202746 RepID=UPI0012643CD9|nr:HD domain-containing phosphohydrolase [Sulfurimonas indica]